MTALVIVLGLACIVGIVAIINNGRNPTAALRRSANGGGDTGTGYGYMNGGGADCGPGDSGGGCDGGGGGDGGGGD